MSDAQALVKLGLAGDRARRAAERVASAQRALESAVRRTLPYLSRRKIPVSSEAARLELRSDAMGRIAKPFHVTPLRVGGAGRASGMLVIDARTIAHGLEGMLGSGRGGVPTLDPLGLSAAQAALAARLSRGLVHALDEIVAPLGASLLIASEAVSEGGAVMIACTIRIGEGDSQGAIVLLIPAGTVDTATAAEEAPPRPQLATQAALAAVDLELVVELGKVRMPLSRITSLVVGEVLRLPISVDAAAQVNVGGQVLWRGKPTTQGSQIAVEIEPA